MTTPIRWGIVGTGAIADAFAHALTLIEDAEIVAVGSRSQASADAFGDKFNIPNRYGSYQGVADDPAVDIAYISTIHPLHHPNSLMCLNAGKAVLCEKPFTMNAGELSDLIDLARLKKLFLMEAMWTRYLPAIVKLREVLAAGTIGEPLMLQADFGFQPAHDPKSRLFNPELGGGALLDIGIYPVSFAYMVLGPPDYVSSQAVIGGTGVDEQAGIVFRYHDGQVAVLAMSLRVTLPCQAIITGTKGRILVHPRFWESQKITVLVDGKETTYDLPFAGSGYRYQAEEAMRCLRAGQLESSTMPLAESLRIMQTLDSLRAAWGLRYPGEL